MKKILIPIITAVCIAAGLFIRYQINAPAKKAAQDMTAINGITAGKTTEFELFNRSVFQSMEPNCQQGTCIYSMERENKLLTFLHLAPRTQLSTIVMVRDGLVMEVFVFVIKDGLKPISVAQTAKLPNGCTASPCLKPPTLADKYLRNINIVFSSDSELRNQMPQALDPTCLSRLHGCSTYAELVPLAKQFNLGSGIQ